MNLSELKHILVVGAGTMGHSIAQVYAQSGFEVELVDLNDAILNNASNQIKANLDTLADLGRLSNDKIKAIIDRIHFSTDLAKAAKNSDLVVEAVSEVPEIKKKVFSQLDELCSEDTILASNTSTLNIFMIVKIKNLKRLVIHHWFAPPHIIPLVEIAGGRKTSREVINLSVDLMKKLGKIPVVLKKFIESCIVNRIQSAINSVIFELLIKKIATPEDIDTAIKNSLGVRLPIVGVVQSLDFTGLDLVSDIIKSKGGVLSIIQDKVDQGNLGAKTGKGFYDYGGRSEVEILKKRDTLYFKILDYLEQLNAFEPI